MSFTSITQPINNTVTLSKKSSPSPPSHTQSHKHTTTHLNIHQDIINNLNYYINIQKIPNIIFYGASGSGKKTLVYQFIKTIYGGNQDIIKKYVMVINCIQMKGIKLIREDLKFFAKTHIHSNRGHIFKSILLLNAEKLTIDAQSALRRLIELFSHTTRFFIIVENSNKLLNPIISRFCEIYIPDPIVKNIHINLYKNQISHFIPNKKTALKTELKKMVLGGKTTIQHMASYKLIHIANKLYNNGYSGIDIIQLYEKDMIINNNINIIKKCRLLILFYIVKKEIKYENMLIFFILYFIINGGSIDNCLTLFNQPLYI